MSERFVVVGAGTMGVGIAYVAAGAGFAVELVEVDPGRAAMAGEAHDALWDKAVYLGRMSTEDAHGQRTQVVMRADVAELADEPDFFNPVWAMPLLAIVVGGATAADTLAAGRALAAGLGKEPVVVRDPPGFATSRLVEMVAEGNLGKKTGQGFYHWENR